MQNLSLQYLADFLSAKYIGDGAYTITGISSLKNATAQDISFINNIKYKDDLLASKAGIILIPEAYQNLLPQKNLILVDDPYVGYAKISNLLNPKQFDFTGIHPTAVIETSVSLHDSVTIGPHAYIGHNTKIGNNVFIGANVTIGKNVIIGDNSVIEANAVIYSNTVLGQKCFIKANATLGGDGYGHANDKGTWIKIPQLGKVILGNNVEIGSSTCVDCGSLEDTIIEDDVIIDNLCQIAHNVHIGAHTAIAGGVILAGGVKIGKYCSVGGASVLNGYITVADGSIITGMSMVMRSITIKGVYSSGIPAQENKKWRKTAALTMQIDKLNSRLKDLEQQLKK